MNRQDRKADTRQCLHHCVITQQTIITECVTSSGAEFHRKRWPVETLVTLDEFAKRPVRVTVLMMSL